MQESYTNEELQIVAIDTAANRADALTEGLEGRDTGCSP